MPVGVRVTEIDLRSVAEEDDRADPASCWPSTASPCSRARRSTTTRSPTSCAAFGDLAFTTGETPVEGHPDLNVVSNVGRGDAAAQHLPRRLQLPRRPPAYTALRAVSDPRAGRRDPVHQPVRRLRDPARGDPATPSGDRPITHVVSGLEPRGGRRDRRPSTRSSAGTRSRAVPRSTSPPRSAASRSAAWMPTRRRRWCATSSSTRPDDANTLRHAWAPGDVVMWDNRCVLHRADHSDVVGDRVMHRGMVAGP